MPPKLTPQIAEQYKNRNVGKYVDEDEKKEVDELPTELKELWNQGHYTQFLKNALKELKLLHILPVICPDLELTEEQEVNQLIEDIDRTYTKFKSCFVSKNMDKDKKKAVKKLPADLKKLWSEEKYKCFLTTALQKVAINITLSETLMKICPSLGSSGEREVHELVQEFYDGYSYVHTEDILEYRGTYINNAQFQGRLEFLLDWEDELDPELQEAIEEAKASETACLAVLKGKLRDRCRESQKVKLTFKVESEFKEICQKTPEPQGGSWLFKAAEAFQSRHRIWFKLDGAFPKCAGVYFLYYIGEHELYTGSSIIGSRYVPVYVGMSTSNISGRLKDHHAKIMEAKDLVVADFAVKVMFVDNRHYAPCLEGMFIEHFSSIWNKEILAICFGVRPNSLWKRIHVDQDPESIRKVVELLKTHRDNSESESESE